MFIKRKSNILYRDFQSFGYLTDNRNFGYILKNASEGFVGDKIISQSGTAFLSVLSRTPHELEDIVTQLNTIFPDIDPRVITEDAIEFFGVLEREGFLISGETIHECNLKDSRFSYRNIVSETDAGYISQFYSPHVQSTHEFLEAYLEGQPQLTNVHIEITGRCNESCIHCYIPVGNRNVEMELSTFVEVLNQCKKMNVLHLTISGGEPMLHRSFIEILRMCRECEFSVNILSNLTHLTAEIIAEMKMNYLLGVQVSLYSMNPRVHDEITGVKGSFEKTKDAILELIENDVPLQIACPIMKNNKDCYHDIVGWAKRLRVNASTDYVVLAQYNNSTNNLDCRLSIEEVEEVIKERAYFDEKFIKQIEDEALKKTGISVDDNICSVCHSSICISERGDVYPCAGWQAYIVGNVKSMSLQDIWINSERVAHLRRLSLRDFPKCIQCADREFCTMCLVRNANEEPSGDPLVTNDFFCAVARLNKKIVRSRC